MGRLRRIKLLFARNLPHKDVIDRWNLRAFPFFTCSGKAGGEKSKTPCLGRERLAQLNGNRRAIARVVRVVRVARALARQGLELNLYFV